MLDFFNIYMAIKLTSVDMESRQKLGLRSGDTVRVWSKVKDKDKVRLQGFEGLILSVKHGTTAGATFTVRRIASGVGVEKIFPLYSPMIDEIEILKRSKVRRAKLYYVRDKAAKEIRRKTSGERKFIHKVGGVTVVAEREPVDEVVKTKEE